MHPVSPYNPPVFRHKTTLMQRALDYVRLGYQWHTSGSVPLAKAAAFARKFRDLYLVHLSADQRYRRKKAGLGNAVLLLWQAPEASDAVTFILLVTDGDHPAHKLEQLNDAHHKNQHVTLTGYELVRLTKAGTDNPVWTWRMTDASYEAWRLRIIRACRTDVQQPAKQAWHSLYGTPGFSGARSQVGKLVALFRAEWRRNKGDKNAFFPKASLGYIQRLKNDSRPLSVVMRPMSAVGIE
ncbi:MAG: hypothetical protein ACYCSS_11495 [Sulfuriferula sp.]